MTPVSRELAMARWALARLGAPYIWGAVGQETKSGGFDCSGLVVAALAAAGGPNWTGLPNPATRRSSAMLAEACDPVVGEPRLGDLAFYGRGTVSHVVLVLERNIVVGANGGGRDCTTPERALELGARVRLEASYRYRSDLLRVGRLPASGG